MDPTINLNKALAAARGKFPTIHKGRSASVKTKDGPGYSYDYADLADVLDAVQPVLSAHGLVLIHEQTTTREPLGVETVAVLLHESGEEKRGLPCWLPCSGTMQPTQAIGSAMTYGRRYTTGPILGISPEADDDGNGASGNDAETKPKAEKPACPKCGKGESVIPGKEEFGGGWLCWKKSKTPGCGHEWETPERKFCGSKALNTNDSPPDDRRPVEPTRAPVTPKETEARVSDELRGLLKEIGCKSNDEADAVIRLCTSGKHDLDGAKHGHSETCKIAIEMTLAMHMKDCGERSKALAVVYADALSNIEK